MLKDRHTTDKVLISAPVRLRHMEIIDRVPFDLVAAYHERAFDALGTLELA